MVLLSTPNGVIDAGEMRLAVRLVIVEGHQRHRYLNALHALGRPPAGLHEVIILSTPLIGGAAAADISDIRSPNLSARKLTLFWMAIVAPRRSEEPFQVRFRFVLKV